MLPTVVIATERLTLTALTVPDAAEVFRYRADPEVHKYQTWAPNSLDEVLRFINDLQSVTFNTPGTWYQLGIRLKASGLFVGDVGVHFPIDGPHQAEIGITIAPDQQGQGIATEAVKGLLGYLFGPLQKHRVFASVDPRNLASVKLMKRVGMRLEAHFHQSLWFKDDWVDDLVFAMLRSEWKCG